MRRLNRCFPTLVICAWTAITVSVVSAAEPGHVLKPYRVVFNCDGHAVAKDAGGDLNQWLENLFGPLENSHVDALF